MEVEATLSSKNQIVVPKEAREALGLKPGAKILFVVHGDNLVLMRRPKSFVKALKGSGPGLYAKDHLKTERDSW
jgi:AbrB family looped-hinge helix DNA binding protein